MTITNYNSNVRVVRTGSGLDAYEELQYRDGEQWVTYATVDEADDYMTTHKNHFLSMLLAKYPEPKKPTKFVASVRPTAFRKDRDETHTFETRDEALAFIKTNTDFCFTEVSK